MTWWCSRERGWRRALRAPPNNTVQVAFPAAAGASTMSFMPDANAAPLTAQKDKTAVTVRWLAHDDNGDDLMFAVWYRGRGRGELAAAEGQDQRQVLQLRFGAAAGWEL